MSRSNYRIYRWPIAITLLLFAIIISPTPKQSSIAPNIAPVYDIAAIEASPPLKAPLYCEDARIASQARPTAKIVESIGDHSRLCWGRALGNDASLVPTRRVLDSAFFYLFTLRCLSWIAYLAAIG